MKKQKIAKAPFKKVIWGIDAQHGDINIQKKTAKAITLLTKGSQCDIEPVYVTPSQDLFLLDEGSWLFDADESTVNAKTEKLLNGLSLKGLKPLSIHKPKSKSDSSVQALLDYANKKKADLIVVSTHARRGVGRFFMGSFAESLFLYSNIPVFVVNPSSNFGRQYKNILFPTDFSDASIETFPKVLSLAKALKAKITLFHKVEYLVEYAVPNMYQCKTYNEYLKLDITRRKEMAEKLKDWANSTGVAADYLIDQGKGFIEDAILKTAKKIDAEVIALASQSGAFSSNVLGSVARRVVRGAPCPVWVVHPKPKKSKSTADPKSAKERIKKIDKVRQLAVEAEPWVRAVGIR